MTTRQYKQYKGLKTESLHNNMTNLELVLNMLSETTTTEISQKEDSHGCRKPNRCSATRSYSRVTPVMGAFKFVQGNDQD